MREGLRCTRRRTGVELGEFDGHVEGRRMDMHWETYGSSKYVSLMDWQGRAGGWRCTGFEV